MAGRAGASAAAAGLTARICRAKLQDHGKPRSKGTGPKAPWLRGNNIDGVITAQTRPGKALCSVRPAQGTRKLGKNLPFIFFFPSEYTRVFRRTRVRA